MVHEIDWMDVLGNMEPMERERVYKALDSMSEEEINKFIDLTRAWKNASDLMFIPDRALSTAIIQQHVNGAFIAWDAFERKLVKKYLKEKE